MRNRNHSIIPTYTISIIMPLDEEFPHELQYRGGCGRCVFRYPVCQPNRLPGLHCVTQQISSLFKRSYMVDLDSNLPNNYSSTKPTSASEAPSSRVSLATAWWNFEWRDDNLVDLQTRKVKPTPTLMSGKTRRVSSTFSSVGVPFTLSQKIWIGIGKKEYEKRLQKLGF